MKRGCPEHVKTESFAAELGIPIAYAVGILEMLCNHFAPRCAPQGDVGKWSDADLVRSLRTDIEPARLISALINAGFLRRHDVHRLVIHDFHEHADEATRKILKRRGLSFATEPPVSGQRPDSVATSSGQRLDTVDPPRAGVGVGVGVGGSSVCSSSSEDPEQQSCNVFPLFPVAREEDGPADFDDFWAAYPKRTHRLEAERAWAKLRPTRGLLRLMLEALGWQTRLPDWLKDSRQYVPNPASWLNGRRWQDEPPDVPDVDETMAHNALAFQRFRERMRDADEG